MLFQRFFLKRKQAADAPKPSTRTLVAPRNQDTLIEQARHHTDAAQRLAAIRQLIDPAIPRQILAEDPDSGIREAAAARYRALLCEPLAPGIALEPLLGELARSQDSDLLEHIAIHGHAPEVRRIGIERLTTARILVECAVGDALAANRGLAVERLHDKAALEEVARRIGKKDKNVYRTARERLRLIAEEEERPRRVQEQRADLCSKLERLGRLGNWTQDRALLEHLERQWASIEPPAEAEWQARFQAERERFLTAFRAHCQASEARIAEQAARRDTLQAAEALLDALSQLPGTLDEAALAAESERIALAWKALPPLPEQEQSALDRRYQALMREAGAARQAFTSQRDQAERLGKLGARLERLLEESKPLDVQKSRQLLNQGSELAKGMAGSQTAQEFQAVAERVEARLRTQRKHAEQRLQQFPERLAALEACLAEGELRKADPLHQSLLAGLELIQASGFHASEAAKLAQRLKALAPRLRELQNWRRWGADQHREGLCADMEALLTKDLPLAALAEQLRLLQMDWKGLDKTGSPANQALWDRFHQASETVYARCRPFMETQAAEREANRLTRERVCQQLEEFLSKVDWQRVDWKKTLRAERDMRQTWSAIGPTEGRQRKQLERRFHQSLRQLDQRLDAERKRNQAHKLELIERVRALAELPDLDAAIEQAKTLQRQWHTTVPARQKDENKLWQQFRAACDAVFERRAAQHQAHASELQDNLTAREAICAEASEIAAREQDPERLSAATRELTERWRAAESLPVPRQAASQLARRWQQSRDALERRRRASEDDQRQSALDLLQRQAELCQRLERQWLDDGVESDARMDPETARQAWNALPTQADGDLQRAMTARFERALSAARDPAEWPGLRQEAVANGQRLERLCLQLEIIAGVETPPELAKQRLELQVARLAERMVEGEEDPLQGTDRLLRDWYLQGPAARDEGLDARFERVRRVLLSTRPASDETHA